MEGGTVTRGVYERRPRPVVERFTSLVDARPGVCWRWRGSIQANGYGRFRANGKTTYAHRAAYALFVGPIPDGLGLDHLCRNRWCVNPEHLEPVTQRENIRRGAQTKLSKESVSEIRAAFASGATTKVALGRKYGVTAMAILAAVRGETWND